MARLLIRHLNALLACLLLGTSLFAQPRGEPIQIGDKFSLHSDVLGEDRPYWVYLPNHYDQTGDPVAVMYLMDGDGHFHHTSGMVQFLINQGRIPEMMIVAIPNTGDRTRDLTPPIEKDPDYLKRIPTAGHADAMLTFMRDELIPHIDDTYNTNNYRILVGHSLGGIFTLQALMTQHDLYSAYISISPSMWYDQQNLVGKAERFLEANPELEGFYYMTMGNEGGDMLGGAMKLAAVFEEKAPAGLDWDFKVMEEETHGSIPHRSTYYGLEAIFKGWYAADMAELYALGGVPGIEKHYDRMSEKLGKQFKVTEGEWNALGYDLMAHDNFDKAIEVFQTNVERFPHSYNAYDSLGEAYKRKGDTDNAIKYYKKSVSIHPGNANGVAMLRDMGVEYDPIQKPLSLSAVEIRPYTGKYALSDGSTVNLHLEQDKLIASMEGAPDLTLVPVYEGAFVTQPGNALLQVKLNEAKKVEGLTVQIGPGQTLTGKPLE